MNLNICALTAQGPRDYNEDRYCARAVGNGKYILGVFDGHGGKDCAEMCAQQAPEILRDLLVQHPANEPLALRKLYSILDAKALELSYMQQGCCAAIVLITKQRAWFSNCGDAMIACKVKHKEHPQWQSQDHKVENEKARIEGLGGIITYWDGCARVFGGLNIGRSIGDHVNKKYISSEPFISSIKTQEIEWICAASDGLWDVHQPISFGEDLKEAMENANGKRKEAVAQVMQKAYRKGSMDNMTVVHCDLIVGV